MQLRDKVSLITGGSSGIGKATAVLFAREGARVSVLARSDDELQQTVTEIEKYGGEAMCVSADVSDAGQVKRAIQDTVDRWGRLDIVFANAGVNGVWAPLEELEAEEWESTLAINLSGTFYTIKYAVPFLKRQGGSIVVTSSVNGTRMFSNTGATAYAASKAGQVALAKMLALELADDGVRVNVICPGAVETEIDENTSEQQLEYVRPSVEYPEGKIPLTHGKPAKASQVAQLVLFLVTDASSHITGTEVWIDGAQSLLQG